MLNTLNFTLYSLISLEITVFTVFLFILRGKLYFFSSTLTLCPSASPSFSFSSLCLLQRCWHLFLLTCLLPFLPLHWTHSFITSGWALERPWPLLFFFLLPTDIMVINTWTYFTTRFLKHTHTHTRTHARTHARTHLMLFLVCLLVNIWIIRGFLWPLRSKHKD